MHELVRGHAGIPHDDDPGLRVPADKVVHVFGLELPLGIGPDAAVDRVVKIIDLQVLERSIGIMKQGLDHVHIGVHGPAAVVDEEHDLQAVRQAAVEDDLDLPGVAHGFVDGLVHIDDVPGAGRG